VRLDPVVRDVDTPGNPDIRFGHHVVQESLKSRCTGRMTHHSIVEADRHHLRMGRAFLVRHIERISDEGELIVPGVYPPHHLSIFVCQRVRDDAMRLAVDCSPKRQLVDVIVTVVEKPAMLHL